jgi:hypothetical protein
MQFWDEVLYFAHHSAQVIFPGGHAKAGADSEINIAITENANFIAAPVSRTP